MSRIAYVNGRYVRDKLITLWLYLPDYPGLDEAMRRALEVAELDQDFQAMVNLDAEKAVFDRENDVTHLESAQIMMI